MPGLAEYLEVCERDGVDPLAAGRAQVASFVRELTSRPSRLGGNTVALDSGTDLANATLRQRLVPVRLFYDFLVEEGVRDSNPVGRGRYGARRTLGGIEAALVHRLSTRSWRAANTKLRVLTRMAYGFKKPEHLVALALLDRGGYCPALPGRAVA